MTTSSLHYAPAPPLSLRLDEACDRFEAAWRAGPPPRIEDYLDGWREPERTALLRELAPLDADYRRARGEAPRPDDYLARFPTLDRDELAAALPAAAPPAKATVTSPGAESTTAAAPVRSFGNYVLLGEIASGGQGVVYRARQKKPNRLVALKTIRSGVLASEVEVRRFQAEVDAVAALEHPNIVPIYEVGVHEGQHYFSMKLIDGGPASGEYEPETAARLVATVARAVHYAHQRGILHRDLKPGNVLIDAQGQPHVTDFGLARRVDGGSGPTQTGAVVGTLEYMAPEQAAGEHKRLTTAVDVHGLGALLYALLTGRPPFQAATPVDTLKQVMHDEPVPPRKRRPAVPRDLELICLKCLSKDPVRRYPSAEEAAKDLERFLVGEPIEARPAGLLERGVRWVRRRPTTAALALVSILAALALVGVIVGSAYGARLAKANGDLATAKDAAETANAQLGNALADARNKALEADTQRGEANRQRGAAEHFLYTAHMSMAAAALQQGRPDQALRLLELHAPTKEHPDDLRDFEWDYMLGMCRASRLPLRGHTAAVLGVAVSPHGLQAASAGADRTVRVWDLATGREVLTLGPYSAEVTCVAYSPDGKLLAGGSVDGAVRIYRLATGEETVLPEGLSGPVNSIAFHPEGGYVACGGAGVSATVWDVQTRSVVAALDNGYSNSVTSSVAFSPSGQFLLVGRADAGNAAQAGNRTELWDWQLRQRVWAQQGTDPIRGVAFSPDGTHVASACGAISGRNNVPPGVLDVRDVATGSSTLHIKDPAGCFTCVAFSPDGAHVVTAGHGGAIKLWDTANGHESLALRGHIGDVTAIAFSPMVPQVLSGGADQTVRLWYVGPEPEPVALWQNPPTHQLGMTGVFDVAFSADGKWAAAVGATGTVVWDALNGKVRVVLPDGGRARLSFSPDGRHFAIGRRVWDSATGAEVASLGRNGESFGYGVSFSPDSRRIAQATKDGAIVRDWQSGATIFTVSGHRRENNALVYAAVFSPDGKWLATAAEDRTVIVWDAATGRQANTFSTAYTPFALAFSPDGTRLAAATGEWQGNDIPGEVKVWDMSTFTELFTLRGHTESVWGVAFNHDGTRLASCSGNHKGLVEKDKDKPGEIKVWDAVYGQELLTLRGGHKGRIFAVAFSPDGKRLASAGEDGFVKIWGPPLGP